MWRRRCKPRGRHSNADSTSMPVDGAERYIRIHRHKATTDRPAIRERPIVRPVRDDLAVLVQDDATPAAARMTSSKSLRRRRASAAGPGNEVNMGSILQRARRCAPTVRAHGRDAKQSAQEPPRDRLLRPAKRNTPGALPPAARRKTCRETMRNGRGRERVAQHRPTAEQVGDRPGERERNATRRHLPRVDPPTVGAERE